MNNKDDRFYYPRGAFNDKVTVEAGQTAKNDIIIDAAFLNGALTLRGTKTLADASSAEITANGHQD